MRTNPEATLRDLSKLREPLYTQVSHPIFSTQSMGIKAVVYSVANWYLLKKKRGNKKWDWLAYHKGNGRDYAIHIGSGVMQSDPVWEKLDNGQVIVITKPKLRGCISIL
ncbi:MAG: hypothetical protein CM1200mP24_04560 [Gammaproteobacteria bacterium]|nr:MAG: hypothetical protein CM1200mP24_04560 [Gammaproteobacteria bacterium]